MLMLELPPAVIPTNGARTANPESSLRAELVEVVVIESEDIVKDVAS